MLKDCINLTVVRGVCFLTLLIATITSYAASTKQFIEGQHYLRFTDKIVNDPRILQFRAKDPNDAQVLEFFSYGCYWCWQLRPQMAKLSKQKIANTSLYRVPIAFHSKWKVLAKAFYLVEMLGLTDRLDQKLFTAAHTKDNNIARTNNLLNFLAKNGVDVDKANALYNSFTMQQKISFSNTIAKAYRIVETPRIVIHTNRGSYVTNIDLAGSKELVPQVIKFLIAKDRTDAIKVPKN